jgi:hypothetical protein
MILRAVLVNRVHHRIVVSTGAERSGEICGSGPLVGFADAQERAASRLAYTPKAEWNAKIVIEAQNELLADCLSDQPIHRRKDNNPNPFGRFSRMQG